MRGSPEMLRLAAFRPNSDKVTKLQLHPTYPWLVSSDEGGNVVVWDWQHRQVIYEVNAAGIDERRLAGAQLQGEAEPKTSKLSLSQAIKDIKGGSVKHVKFYDDDVRYWQGWLARSAISHSVAQDPGGHQPTGPGPLALRGRHFLVICCDNKAIFLDMVSMIPKDVPKLVFDNKAPLCVEFLLRSGLGDGPLAAFGGPDGAIRVLSMQNWLVVQRFAGAHKGPIACLKAFLAVTGETLLVSGGNDGLLTFWSVDTAREATPKLSLKGHDGGVTGIELIRVQGGPPQLVTIGADKTLAVWDTLNLRELRRMKPVSKMACTSVATWSHPRAPNLNILTCAKDSHIWTVEHYGGVARPLCDLTIMIPPAQLPPGKKLKTYCLAVHPLQPHLVAAGTNFGVILSEFDAKAVPAAVPLPTPVGSKEHRVVCNVDRELRVLTFQLAAHVNTAVISAGDTGARFRSEIPTEAPTLLVKQTRVTQGPVANDSAALLAASHSGRYISLVWPELPAYEIYRVSDWARVDYGVARLFTWDTCKDRYALLQTVAAPKVPLPGKISSSKKAREAAAAHAAALAASAAAAAAAGKVEVRILRDDGSVNVLMKAIEGRNEAVSGLQGGALLGVAYRFPKRTVGNSLNLPGGFGGEDGLSSGNRVIGEAPPNFQLYSWENYKPVSPLLPQPEWTAWDQTVEYCALAYHRYIVISSLRPQYRFLGTVAIGSATGGVWHRRQFFLATPTTIECVFVDAGVSAVDLERKKKKDEQRARAAQAKSLGEQGELALLHVESPELSSTERISLRPPMLQVVRLASFHSGPSAPPVLNLPKQAREREGLLKEPEERRGLEVAIGGGGVSVAASRLPQEQKRPVGPLIVVGVRDGVLWLVDMLKLERCEVLDAMLDRFMTAHAIALSHPGIRCRCLAAYGDAVSAVKWASKLGREHHDDLAEFMLGMGYAAEALHLPGISKRLEFDLALQSGDLKKGLQALIILSNSKGFTQDVDLSNDSTGVLTMAAAHDAKAEALLGIVKYAPEFLELIDAADSTGQGAIARQALTRLAAAGSVEGGLNSEELRALSYRLATHGELTRLALQANRMIKAGLGHEAALAGAFLGDPNLLEKAWEDTGMYPEATLHAQAHGRPTAKDAIQQWNRTLQNQYSRPTSKAKPDIGATPDPVLAALEGGTLPSQKDGVLQSLVQARQPLIQIFPPGNVPTSSQTIPLAAIKSAAPAGPMLALPAPQSTSQPTDGVHPVPSTEEPLTASKDTESHTDIKVPPTSNPGPQQPSENSSQHSLTATDLDQLATSMKTPTGVGPSQAVLGPKSLSEASLSQGEGTAGSGSGSHSSGDVRLASDLSTRSVAPSQPQSSTYLTQPLPSTVPHFSGVQTLPSPPTQPLNSPRSNGFVPSPSSVSARPQSFSPQLAQPFDPRFQAFDPQSPQPFDLGFQASSVQTGLGSLPQSNQAFPSQTGQGVASQPNQAFSTQNNPAFLPQLNQGFPAQSNKAFLSQSNQIFGPAFQAFPSSSQPHNPSSYHSPKPAVLTSQGAPASFPSAPGVGHPPFPPTTKSGGAQAFPFPLSTSTSVASRGFPLPMSTSGPIGETASKGSQHSLSDLQLVPVNAPSSQQAPNFSSSNRQIVPASSSGESHNDRPFF